MHLSYSQSDTIFANLQVSKTQEFYRFHPKSGMSMPLAARSVTRSTLDFLAANLAALIFLAAESGT